MDSDVRVTLIHPPSGDPTAPHLALPALAGWLRPQGVAVELIDANLEAYLDLLRRPRLAAMASLIERRLSRLARRTALDHASQLLLLQLTRARDDAGRLPRSIDDALATLRDPAAFFDAERYRDASDAVDRALDVISAAHAPLDLRFTSYRTPFALLSPEEIAGDALPERDPFDAYVTRTLIPRLVRSRPDIVGLSAVFPGQLQPAYAFAAKIRRALPGVHLTVGGPAMAQLLLRLEGERLERALAPFDSAVVLEGEPALLALAEALQAGRSLETVPNLVLRNADGHAARSSSIALAKLAELPAPDFTGLPLADYLSPNLVLPYDPSRGCYWGKCAFCHYGLARQGTARYRERRVDDMAAHLGHLSLRHGTRLFYFSQDTIAPKTLERLAQALSDARLDLRWATDIRPERALTPERARAFRRGGALACSLGIESAAPRVLSLIDKGTTPGEMRQAAHSLAHAGIAVEAMCISDFPGETAAESMETIEFLNDLSEDLALFILGEFHLTHGARVAREPARYGIEEVWSLEGDELGTGIFYAERVAPKSGAERAKLERALDRLSRRWRLGHYPWAGSLSTAHTLLYYERFGPSVFRDLARRAGRRGPAPSLTTGDAASPARRRLPSAKLARALAREAALWEKLIYDERRVSRARYQQLASELPLLRLGKNRE